MKILVPVKQVAMLDDEFEMRDDGRDVDEDFFEKDLNEFDHFAVEEALLIKEAAGDGAQVEGPVGRGPGHSDEYPRHCPAMRAPR